MLKKGGVIGITVGNFKEVKELTLEGLVRRASGFRIITVGSLASTGALTRLFGCSSTRNEFGNRVRIGRNTFMIGKRRVGIATREGPTSLP